MSASFIAPLVWSAFIANAGIVGAAVWIILHPRTSDAVRIYALKLAVSGQRLFATIVVVGFVALRLLESDTSAKSEPDVPGIMTVESRAEPRGNAY
jgi:hypothetical protein